MGMPLPESWDVMALRHGALKTLDFFSDEEIVFFINGLMSIVGNESFIDEEEILNNGIKLDEFPSFSSPLEINDGERLYFTIAFNENFYQNKQGIQIDNLFILDKNLDDFLKKNAKPPKKEKVPATKTLNSQAEFIRNLIIMSYGEEVADSIRKELDNPNSEISIDFQTKGLKAPSGKTVDRWINQI